MRELLMVGHFLEEQLLTIHQYMIVKGLDDFFIDWFVFNSMFELFWAVINPLRSDSEK